MTDYRAQGIHHSTSPGKIVTVPLSVRAHFENPVNRADLGGAELAFIDPTDPGHDFLTPDTAADTAHRGGVRGLAARILGR